MCPLILEGSETRILKPGQVVIQRGYHIMPWAAHAGPALPPAVLDRTVP